jgi:hypothetical protein
MAHSEVMELRQFARPSLQSRVRWDGLSKWWAVSLFSSSPGPGTTVRDARDSSSMGGSTEFRSGPTERVL